MKFDYKTAFKRNIGLMSESELKKLKTFTIAIPGMGWVWSSHIISLVRQWFQKFKIADFDRYELHNFNRQIWATLNTVGSEKAKIMKEKALEINPNCEIKIYEKWINKKNIDDFLDWVDLAIDALDIFVVEIKRIFFNECHKKKIPCITAWPIWYGCAWLIFMPEWPNFDKYFNVNENTSYDNLLLSFWLWLTPSLLHISYMKNVSLKNKTGPSSIAGVNVCSWFITVNALKILLNWWNIKPVPYYHQYDMMKNKYVCKRLLFWLKSPWQKIKFKIALKMISEIK